MSRQPARLRIDPVACDGIGMCIHLAPDVITVDPWGYPVIDSQLLEGERLKQARKAVRGCPKRALFLAP